MGDAHRIFKEAPEIPEQIYCVRRPPARVDHVVHSGGYERGHIDEHVDEGNGRHRHDRAALL